jgi:predicted DNA-binding transcriptional regulator YafY
MLEMPKENYISRYLLIIKRLQKSPADFTQLLNYLERESEIRGYDYTLSLRTFQREIKEIEKLGYEIKYDKSTKVYCIAETESNPEQSSRILEAFEMLDLVRTSGIHTKLIQFERRKPQGLHHFHGLLHAIKNNKVVTIEYQKFYEDEPCYRELFPISLKESRGRWYLIAKDPFDDYIKIYGLDRIIDFEIGKKAFPKEIASESKDYEDCFGVLKPSEGKAQKIVLSFEAFQGKYKKSFPLHGSKKVLKDDVSEFRIELFLFITHDFIMELLSYGKALTVISPQSLKETMKKEHEDALKNYN